MESGQQLPACRTYLMTGFRILSPVTKVFKNLRESVKASVFEPDVQQFLRKSLASAIQLTPARNLGTIRRAQKKQYANRINYIPSIHELQDPTLIVKEDSDQWLWTQGKWYRPDKWKLPPDVWATYQQLLHERERRLETKEEEFISERAQARFLYKRSWYEVGQSVGLDIPCSQEVKSAHTRRKPPKAPPKGYAQRRGGRGIFSIVVYDPFLEEQTAYWFGSGKRILDQAMQKHKAAFDDNVADRQARIILRILRALL